MRRVSVIIAAYNVEAYIGRAIASVQAQTVSDLEILIVDDASRDGTATLVNHLASTDPRIRLLSQPENRGPSAARNRAVREAEGEWVAVLDADDAWRPERLEKLLELAGETGAEAVADNQILFDDSVKRESGVAFTFPDRKITLDAEALFSRSNPLELGILKMMFRRSMLAEHGLAYDESLRFAEDLKLLCEFVLGGGRVMITNDAYYIYTTPVGHITRTQSSGTRSETSRRSILAILDGLVAKYAERITPAIKAGLERCRRITIQRWTAGEITRLRRQKDYGRLLLFLVSHPEGAARYVTTSSTWKRRLGRGAPNPETTGR